MSKLASRKKAIIEQGQEIGPWDASLTKLREWDPTWAEQCSKMTTNPWTNGILPRKTIELICIAVNATCTNLNVA